MSTDPPRDAPARDEWLDRLPHPLAMVVWLLALSVPATALSVCIALLISTPGGPPFEEGFGIGRISSAGFVFLIVLLLTVRALGKETPPEAGERVGLPSIAFASGLQLTGLAAESDFFDTSAQVIPVLLLTLLVERRTLMVSGAQTRRQRGAALFVVLGLCIGEGFALAAGAEPALRSAAVGIVAGALLAGFDAILLNGFGAPPGAQGR